MSIYRKYDDKELEAMWDELEDVPTFLSEDYYTRIERNWNGWDRGTSVEEIWDWFDKQHSKGVYWLMNEYEGR